jgi:hypothetical protein
MKLFRFIEIFRVSLKHDYYKKQYSADFIFEPSEYCRKLLKNYHLKFNPRPHGFAVFGDAEESGGTVTLTRGLQDDLKFTFLLKLNNPYFLNLTDIPVKTKPHTIYYFNNLTDHQNPPGSDLLLIDKDEIPKTSSNQSQMIMSPEIYNYTHSGTDASKTGTLTFVDDGISIDKTLANDNDKFNFQFDLSRFNPGRCEFSVGNGAEKFYAANEIYRQNVFGIIEIFAKSAVPDNYQFVQSPNIVNRKEYVIHFKNRHTIWRYLIYDKLTGSLANPQIHMAGVDFHREHTPATAYPEDYALYKFTSGEVGSSDTEKTIPLKDEPQQNIRLSGSINSTSRDIFQHLPNPDISLIKPDKTNISKIYSDIIVYV